MLLSHTKLKLICRFYGCKAPNILSQTKIILKIHINNEVKKFISPPLSNAHEYLLNEI